MDLMFSHPLDPPSVIAARATELAHVRRWIKHASAVSETQADAHTWWEARGRRAAKQHTAPHNSTPSWARWVRSHLGGTAAT